MGWGGGVRAQALAPDAKMQSHTTVHCARRTPTSGAAIVLSPSAVRLAVLELLHHVLAEVVVIGEGMQGRPQRRHGDCHRVMCGALYRRGKTKL
eukprot:UN2223